MDLRTVLQNRRRTVEELGEMASGLVPEPHKSRMEEFVKTLVEVEREDARAMEGVESTTSFQSGMEHACRVILEMLAVDGYEPHVESVVSAMDKLVHDAVPDDGRFIEMQIEVRKLTQDNRALKAAARGNRELENVRLLEQVNALSDANAVLRQERDEARENARSMVAEVDATAKRNSELRKELEEAREWLQAGSETKSVLRRERDAAQQQILELQRALKEERDNCLRLAGEVDRLAGNLALRG